MCCRCNHFERLLTCVRWYDGARSVLTFSYDNHMTLAYGSRLTNLPPHVQVYYSDTFSCTVSFIQEQYLHPFSTNALA